MLTRLVLPLQIAVASAIVLALSVRHLDQYRQHLERFGLKPSQESKEQQQQQQSD
jgi:H+/Cl- antiporter ClcA